MNFLDFLKKFSTEEACIKHFINVRYSQGAVCNHCGNKTTYRRGESKNFDCKKCNNTFSIFKNTIFEKSDTDLRKWFFAIHLFLNGKKGISGLQLQREIGVTYKTAWRMLQKTREAMGKDDNDDDFRGLMQGIIDADDTYVGGKEESKHEHNKSKSAKSVILGLINREKKLAKAFHVESAKYFDYF
jgi:transposase-like protein